MTPATEAGRRLLEFLYPQHGGAMRTDAVAARIIAIEAEARADSLREVGERLPNALRAVTRATLYPGDKGYARWLDGISAAILAILDPQP